MGAVKKQSEKIRDSQKVVGLGYFCAMSFRN